jgi:hypothetical protein
MLSISSLCGLGNAIDMNHNITIEIDKATPAKNKILAKYRTTPSPAKMSKLIIKFVHATI